MKTVEIKGKNFVGKIRKKRTACRAAVLDGDKLLLSYETKTDTWMLPGGGRENGETDADCCRREVEEETGILVDPTECFLETDEYYGDRKWVNRYFLCRKVGTGERHLTDWETGNGMEPRWVSLNEIKAVFAKYREYAETNEDKRGMYFREYTAVCELEKHLAGN